MEEINNSFTLIELLVVLAVISVILSIAVPTYLTYKPDIELNEASRDLVTDIRYSQQLAITEQVEYCTKFFLLEKKYQILKCDQTNVVLVEKSFPAEISEINIVDLSNNEIRFNPYGTVREGGNIILRNIKNNTKKIEIKPSGFVKTYDS